MNKSTFSVNLIDTSDMTLCSVTVTRKDLISLMNTEGVFRVIVYKGDTVIKDYKRISYAKKFASFTDADTFTLIRR